MSKSRNSTNLSLTQQANIIRCVGVLVAKRHTSEHAKHLYAVDDLFVELSFAMNAYWKPVDEIKYLNTTDGLQPYLDDIVLTFD